MSTDTTEVIQGPPVQAGPNQSELDRLEVLRYGLIQPYQCLVDAGKPLTNYQLLFRRKAMLERRLVLSLDKGLGKTLAVLSIFESPEFDIPGFSVVLFTTERGMGAYTRDIKLFPNHEGKIQLVKGSREERFRQWRNPTAKYFIVTPATFLSDLGVRSGKHAKTDVVLPKWVLNGDADAWLFDEFHRYMRRKDSKFFSVIVPLCRKAEYVIPYSGSAVSKSPMDIWPALHLVDPKLWSSYWKYAYTWCEIDDTGFGRRIAGPRGDRVAQWRRAVSAQLFHRTKAMVGDQLPPKRRELLDVLLHPWQRKLHDSLQYELYAEIGPDNYIFATNNLSKLFKMRLAMICPKALDESLDVGAGIEAIWDDAGESELRTFAVATPFRAPIPILADWLSARGARVFVLVGGIGLDEQERRLDQYRMSLQYASPESPSVLLYTIAYGESWEAPECSYGYMLGYEWDREVNKQAEDRIHRLISPLPVFWQWVRSVGAYDEEHLQRLVEAAAAVEKMFGHKVE